MSYVVLRSGEKFESDRLAKLAEVLGVEKVVVLSLESELRLGELAEAEVDRIYWLSEVPRNSYEGSTEGS